MDATEKTPRTDRTRLKPDEIKKVLEMTVMGAPQVEIARQLGRSKSAVSRTIRRNRSKLRGKSPGAEVVSKIRELAANGWTHRRIAKKVGWSPATVSRLTNGVPAKTAKVARAVRAAKAPEPNESDWKTLLSMVFEAAEARGYTQVVLNVGERKGRVTRTQEDDFRL